MIKIIKGVYGVKRADSKSAPFSLSAKEEARLVSLGVAEYVGAPEAGVSTEGKPASKPKSKSKAKVKK